MSRTPIKINRINDKISRYSFKSVKQKVENKNNNEINKIRESIEAEYKLKSIRLAKCVHELKNVFITVNSFVEMNCGKSRMTQENNTNKNSEKLGNISIENRKSEFDSSPNNFFFKNRVNTQITFFSKGTLYKSPNNNQDTQGIRDLNNNQTEEEKFMFLKALCDYGMTLITDINNLAKDEKSKEIQKIEEFRLVDALKFCYKMFKVRAPFENKNVGIYSSIKIPKDTMNKSISETKFKQVVINLLSNSFKFTTNGEISLSAQNLEGFKKIRITIKDTGKGFDVNEFKNFEAFHVDKNNQNLNKNGSGLGLSIVNDILKKFNSKLEFTSSKNGSTFWFDIIDTNPLNRIINLDELLTPKLAKLIDDINSGKKDKCKINMNDNLIGFSKKKTIMCAPVKFFYDKNDDSLYKDKKASKNKKDKSIINNNNENSNQNMQIIHEGTLEESNINKKLQENQSMSSSGNKYPATKNSKNCLNREEVSPKNKNRNNLIQDKNIINNTRNNNANIKIKNNSRRHSIKGQELNKTLFTKPYKMYIKQSQSLNVLKDSSFHTFQNENFNKIIIDPSKKPSTFKIANDLLEASKKRKSYEDSNKNEEDENNKSNEIIILDKNSKIKGKKNKNDSNKGFGRAMTKNNFFNDKIKKNLLEKVNKPKQNMQINIIICDDQRYIRKASKKVITDFFSKPINGIIYTINIQICVNGIDCLFFLYKSIEKKIQIHFILIDGDMPYLDGIDTINIIKKSKEFKLFNIFLLSGEATTYKSHCLADGFFEKPLKVEDLKEILEIVFPK